MGEAQREVLQLEINADGMVSGRRVAVRELDEIKRKAGETGEGMGRFDSMLSGVGSRLTSFAGIAGLAAGAFALVVGGAFAAVSALRPVVSAAMESERASAQLEATLRSTAGAAGLEREALTALAGDLMRLTGVDDDLIVSAESVMLTFTRIGEEAFPRALEAALDLSTKLGTDLKSAVIQVGKALNDPVEGVTALGRAGVQFSDSQKSLIKDLVETNRLAEAQAIVLGELETQMGGSARAARDTLGGAVDHLQGIFGNFQESIGGELLPVLRGMVEGAISSAGGLDGLGASIGRVLAVGMEWLAWGAATAAMLVSIGTDAAARMMQGLSWIAGALASLNEAAGLSGAAFREAEANLLDNALAAAVAGDAADVVAKGLIAAALGADKYSGAAAGAAAGSRKLGEDSGLSAAELKKLKDEIEALTAKYQPAIAEQQEWAADLRRMTTLYQQGRIGADLLAAALAHVEQKLAALNKLDAPEIKLPSPDEMLTEIETRWVDSIEEGAAAWREVDAIIDDLAIDAMIADAQGFMKETLALEKEWEEFQKQVSENFVRGVQSSLSTFFYDLLSGGEDALKNFGRSLKDLLFKTLAEYLAQWAITQAKMLVLSLARIAKEKAAQQAANAAGGGGGGGGLGNYSSLASGAGMVVAAFAVVAAVAALTNAYRQSQEKKTYGTTAGGKVEDGQMYFGWSGKLSETGAKVASGIQGLLEAFQSATGSFIEGLAQAQVRIRNDKKVFEAIVNGEVIGTFKTAEEAIIGAAKRMFLEADLSKALDPIVRQVIENYQGKDPAQFAEAVSKVQGIMNELSGLSDIEIALRDLPSKSAALASELRSMGVSMGDAQRVAMEWRLQQMQNLRDQITGRQRTAAEEMAERQRQAAMFNAELALMKAELEAKRAELVAKQTFVRADGEIVKLETDLARRGVQERLEIQRAAGMVLDAEIQMQATWANSILGITAAVTDTLSAQIAAIDQILANLPAAIDPKEIRIGTGGRGGGAGGAVSAGPSKQDQLRDFLDALQQIERQALPPLIAQLADLEDWYSANLETAERLGVPLERITALYEQQRQALVDQAQAEVGQYLQSPEASRLAEIYAWRDEMVEVYTSLGLDIQPVLDATAAQLRQLGQDVLGSLGLQSVSTRQQFEGLAAQLEFLRNNLEALGLTTEDYAAITRELGDQAFLSLADGLAQFVGTEEQKAALEQLRWEMELYNYELQFQYLQSLGLLTAEQIALVQALLDAAAGYDPATGSGGVYDPFGITTGGDSSNAGGWGGSGDSETDQAMQDLIRALDRLREFQESLLLNQSVTPLTIEQQYYEAQQQYLDLLAAAQSTDPAVAAEAIAALPAATEAYLDLAAQMFGSATLGYQQIFEEVVAQIEAVLGSYEPPAAYDWGTIHGDLGGIGTTLGLANNWHQSNFEELGTQSIYLTQIRDLLEDTEPTGGGGGGGGTAESRMAQDSAQMLLAGAAARVLAFPSGELLSGSLGSQTALASGLATLNATMLRVEQRLSKLDRLDDIERRLGDVEREVRASGQAMDRAVTSAPVGGAGLTTVAAPSRRRGVAA